MRRPQDRVSPAWESLGMADSKMVETEREIRKVFWGFLHKGHVSPRSADNFTLMGIHVGVIQVLSALGMNEFSGVQYPLNPHHIYEFYAQEGVARIFPALARHYLVETALEKKMDYLFMVDDDMLFEVDLFDRLVKHDVDICAALAFSRYKPIKPVIYNLKDGYDSTEKKSYYINYPVFGYPKDQLVECDAVGFGAVLIKCRVLEAYRKHWFMNTSGAGEDIHFCWEARKAGFRVFMDTSAKLGHMGDEEVITEEDYESEENQRLLKEMYAAK